MSEFGGDTILSPERRVCAVWFDVSFTVVVFPRGAGICFRSSFPGTCQLPCLVMCVSKNLIWGPTVFVPPGDFKERAGVSPGVESQEPQSHCDPVCCLPVTKGPAQDTGAQDAWLQSWGAGPTCHQLLSPAGTDIPKTWGLPPSSAADGRSQQSQGSVEGR